MIYLDAAATTLIKPASVPEAVKRAMLSMSSPGRGAYAPAMRAAEALYDCRSLAAELFHVPEPEQVVFTMNATHGLNLAIGSLVKPGMKVLCSGFEHNAVTRALQAYGAEIMVARGESLEEKTLVAAFEERISGAELVVCTHVSNVFGLILPIEEIARLCREYHRPLIVDASQSAGVLDLDFETLKAAFVAMPGHKGLYGPQGTGLLLCRDPGRPLLHGGSGSDSLPQTMPEQLPDRLEAGTHNVPGIAGLLEGLRFIGQKGCGKILAHEQILLEKMVRALSGCEFLELYCFPGRQSGVLSLRCACVDCEELAALLAQRGICVRSGLHCAPFAHRTMQTLETGTLRVSFSAFTDEAEVQTASAALCDLAGSYKEKLR